MAACTAPRYFEVLNNIFYSLTKTLSAYSPRVPACTQKPEPLVYTSFEYYSWRLIIRCAWIAQRTHYSDEDPFADINYRVQRAVRAQMAADMAMQEAQRPRSPRPVRGLTH